MNLRKYGLVLWVAMAALGCKAKSTGEASREDLPKGAVPVTSAAPLTPATPSAAPARLEPAAAGAVAPISFAPIARKADPSVVTISTRAAGSRSAGGLGTGFIYDDTGVVLTNYHVIRRAAQIVVQLSDERAFEARVIGHDESTDIGVLKLDDAKDLKPIALADSDRVEVGDWVVAIGNPFGLSHTVSAGIVSAKHRGQSDVPLDPSGYYDFLQTDASINPGNSGGPLLNLDGEVVGVNTAIRGGGAQGIGFAIPINLVKQLLPSLLKEGHFTRSALGVLIQDVGSLTAREREARGIKVAKGVLVTGVAPNGPAEQAGLKAGDVVVGFDGKEVQKGTLLQWLASTAGVGKKVTVRVQRGETAFDKDVTLGKLPDDRRRARSMFEDEP
ncbi:MAG: trypsin-like peptidase domain-containing protein [Polyangiaceae bacterium]